MTFNNSSEQVTILSPFFSKRGTHSENQIMTSVKGLSLSDRDLIACNFGPEYYRGVMWGSGCTFFLTLMIMRRAHLNGLASLKKATERAASAATQEVSGASRSFLDQHAPGSAAQRSEFTRKNKVTSVYQVDWVSYTLVRVMAITAAVKLGKFVLSQRRYNEFLYDAEIATEGTQKLLDVDAADLEKELARLQKEEQTASSPEKIESAQRELAQFEAAMRVRALDDFRKVAELEQRVAEKKAAEQQMPGLMLADERFHASKKKESDKRMPSFWDGVSVGVLGSLLDADVPRHPVHAYLGMKAGKFF